MRWIKSVLSGRRRDSCAVGAPSGLFPNGNRPVQEVDTLGTRVVAGQQTRTRYWRLVAGGSVEFFCEVVRLERPAGTAHVYADLFAAHGPPRAIG